jgi:glutaredoxin/glutathione-dependent peroxiredoxin
MSISIGQKIPQVTVKRLGENGMEEVNLAQYLGSKKKVVVFAVPGAFTPTCAQKHLPGYIEAANDIKSKGVEEIVCIAVNDPFVMKNWGEIAGAAGRVTMMPDGNGAFTKALGMEFDGSGAGLGVRSKRYMMVIENGTVTRLEVENAPGDLEFSSANACMKKL